MCGRSFCHRLRFRDSSPFLKRKLEMSVPCVRFSFWSNDFLDFGVSGRSSSKGNPMVDMIADHFTRIVFQVVFESNGKERNGATLCFYYC